MCNYVYCFVKLLFVVKKKKKKKKKVDFMRKKHVIVCDPTKTCFHTFTD